MFFLLFLLFRFRGVVAKVMWSCSLFSSTLLSQAPLNSFALSPTTIFFGLFVVSAEKPAFRIGTPMIAIQGSSLPQSFLGLRRLLTALT